MKLEGSRSAKERRLIFRPLRGNLPRVDRTSANSCGLETDSAKVCRNREGYGPGSRDEPYFLALRELLLDL
jgi:hypothetical protein